MHAIIRHEKMSPIHSEMTFPVARANVGFLPDVGPMVKGGRGIF